MYAFNKPEKPWNYVLDQVDRGLVRKDVSMFAFLLRNCAEACAFVEGKRVHAHILNSGFADDRFLGNLIIHMYGKCGALEDSCAVFNHLHGRNAFSWALIINACVQNARGDKALGFYAQMLHEKIIPDKVTCVHILSACTTQVSLDDGQRLHDKIIVGSAFEWDVVVCNALMNMYGKCGCLSKAQDVFDQMPERDVVSWNTLLAAYAQCSASEIVCKIFWQMHAEGMFSDKVACVIALNSFGCRKPVVETKCIHVRILAKGDPAGAVDVASHSSLAESKRMHVRIIARGDQRDIVVGTALVNVYTKCRSILDAWKMFAKMGERNVITWSVIIAAYVQHGYNEKAHQLFQQMQWEGVIANKVTHLTILVAYANETAISKGKRLHSCIIGSTFEMDAIVVAALINMYSKCGSLEHACNIFDRVHHKDTILWSSIIAAYTHHGHNKEVFQLLHQMQIEGLVPNQVTFFSLLTACSHAGLADECCFYLTSMNQDLHTRPSVEHHNCLVDLLARVGRLDEGERVIRNMPNEPTAMSWMALLSGCKMHMDIERGICAAERVAALDPEDSTPYILLSNIHAASAGWDVEVTSEGSGLRKPAGECLSFNVEEEVDSLSKYLHQLKMED